MNDILRTALLRCREDYSAALAQIHTESELLRIDSELTLFDSPAREAELKVYKQRLKQRLDDIDWALNASEEHLP